MKPPHEFPNNLDDDAVEPRIVAWVHGEASVQESAELDRLCAARPELADFRRQMSALHQSLIQVESPAADWKLPADKRRKLDEIFSEGKVVNFPEKNVVSPLRRKFQMLVAIAACFLLAAVVLPKLMPNAGDDGANLTSKVTAPTVNRGNEIYDVDSMANAKNRDSGLQEATRQRQLAGKKPSEPLEEIVAASPVEGQNLAAASDHFSMEPQERETPDGALSVAGVVQPDAVSQAIAAATPAVAPPLVARNEKSSRRRVDAAAEDLRSAESVGTMAPAEPVLPLDRNSTFPFNAGDVSFQLAKKALAQGLRPDPSAIQLEQFYNAVDYCDPALTVGESVAATTDQSAHPFLPGTQLVRVALLLGSAAKEVKVEVKFNPQRVGKYQLLGFEKDKLNIQGAGNFSGIGSGVAIYQIESLPIGSGEMGEVSVRFRDPVSHEMSEQTWTISFPTSPTAFAQAAPSMQLAGLSLLAAEKLRGGAAADLIDFHHLPGPISRVKQFYGSNSRVCQMLQVIEQLK